MSIPRRSLRGTACILLPAALLVLLSLWLAAPARAEFAPCPGNRLSNANFEAAGAGWEQSTSGQGPKCHWVIKQSEFYAHDGEYAAVLGGYEGVIDQVSRSFVLPPGARLTYWWRYASNEPPGYTNDRFEMWVEDAQGQALNNITHTLLDEDRVWQQDAVDLSAYAGQTITLNFLAYNDINYASTWGVDSICLTGTDFQPTPILFLPQLVHDRGPGLPPQPYHTPTPQPHCP